MKHTFCLVKKNIVFKILPSREMDVENYEIGQKLIVELENEILVGDLKLISKDKRVIELSNVKDFNTGFVFTSPQCIIRPLIKSIKCCKEPDTPSNTDQEEIKSLNNDYMVPITCDELDQIQAIVSSAVYIFQVDQKYHKAIANLKQQSVIGLHIEPTNFGRHNRTALMALTTCENIYIFDLVSLGAVFKDLKNILQAKSPKKVVYHSNKIADNLKYKHKVQLEGVFDIFVAHCLISKQTELTNFDECVVTYLNIPIRYFLGDNESQVNIYDRPLAKVFLDAISKKAVFLLKLYDHMVHEIMLKNFYNQCRQYSESFAKNECDVEVAMQMAPNSTHGMSCIGDIAWADLLERNLKL